MPDITMCKGDGCNRKLRCYRYQAIPDYRQSYFFKTPIEKGDFFDFFWPMESESETHTDTKSEVRNTRSPSRKCSDQEPSDDAQSCNK